MMNRVIACVATCLLAPSVVAADTHLLLAQAGEVACTMDYTPVCGADGNTYSNECVANVAGVEIVAEGECPAATNGEETGKADSSAEDAIDGQDVVEEEQPDDSESLATPPQCSEEYDPVCGVNGRTYLNRCEANVDRVPVQRASACDVNNCPPVFAPVCGNDGVTYDNACLADKAGITSYTVGICNQRPCPNLFVPVCGADNLTYSNACYAERLGTRIDYAGMCEEQGRNCPRVYLPVCGLDGITYDNECQLENAGVIKAYAGACLGD